MGRAAGMPGSGALYEKVENEQAGQEHRVMLAHRFGTVVELAGERSTTRLCPFLDVPPGIAV